MDIKEVLTSTVNGRAMMDAILKSESIVEMCKSCKQQVPNAGLTAYGVCLECDDLDKRNQRASEEWWVAWGKAHPELFPERV